MASADPVSDRMSDESSVYVIGMPGGPYKIGYSRTPYLRAAQARREGRGEARLIREWVLPRYQLARAVEHYAHWLLRADHYGSEWFNVTEETAIETVEYALRPEAIAAYSEHDVIPSITQACKGTELFCLRLARGTGDRISAVLGTSRGQSDYVRRAVEECLQRDEEARERSKLLKPD